MALKRHFLPQFLRSFVQDDVVLDSDFENVGDRSWLVQVCDEIQDEVIDLPPSVCETKLKQKIKVINSAASQHENTNNDSKKAERIEVEDTKGTNTKNEISKDDITKIKITKVYSASSKNTNIENAQEKEEKKKQANEMPSVTTIDKLKETKTPNKKKNALKADIAKISKSSTSAMIKSKDRSSVTIKITSKLKLVLPSTKFQNHSNSINITKSIAWKYRNIMENRYKMDTKRLRNKDPDECHCAKVSPGCAGCGDNCINRMTLTECDPEYCVNGEDCTNNVIQKKQFAPGLQRFMTDGKGWGVRAQNTLKAGQYLLEYTGEVVDEDTFENRMKKKYIRDKHHYCMALGGGLFIDAHRMGSECRFVNHSCEPNSDMIKWSVGGLSRMALFTRRKIKLGEEITYDYNFDNYNALQGQTCKCGSTSCRGIIGGKGDVRPMRLEQKLKMQPVVKLMKCSKTISKSSKVAQAMKSKKEKPAKLDYRKVIKTKFPHRPVTNKFGARQSNYLVSK